MAGLAGEAVRQSGCYLGPPSAHALLTFASGRWKLWGEEEGGVQASHSDPEETYTSACWGRIVVSTGTSEYFALGCTSGRLQVWNPRSSELLGPVGEALRAVAGGADSAVTALAASKPERASVFVGCSALQEILEVGVLDGATRRSFKAGKKGIVCLAASSAGGEWLLSVGTASALKLWHLPDISASAPPRAHARLVGPANPVSCLDLWCSAESVVALFTDGSTQIGIFTCSAAGSGHGSKDLLNASLVLSIHVRIQAARFVESKVDTKGAVQPKSGRLGVVGVGPTIAAYWQFDLPDGAKSRTVSPIFTVASSQLGGRVLDARAGASVIAGPESLLVAYGPQARPSFAKVQAPTGGKGSAPTIEFFTGGSGAAGAEAGTVSTTKSASVARRPPTILGPLEASVTRPVEQVKRPTAGLEPPDGEGGTSEKRRKITRPSLPELGRPSANEGTGLSMAPLVSQALRARDGSSVDQVLKNADRRVMDSTVADISGAQAFDLLQECTQRLVSQPVQGQVLCAWIQRILLHHCAYISSQPFLHGLLEPLRLVFQARCGAHSSLAELLGRLRALQALGRRAAEESSREEKTVRTPLLQYVEGDEEKASDGEEEGSEEEEAGSDVEASDESPLSLADILGDDGEDF